MEDRLESESRLGGPGSEVEIGTSQMTQAPVEGAIELNEISKEIDTETKLLISRCLDGSEPYGRDLKPWEQQKFNAINVQAVLLRAAGFKQVDIARLLNIEQHRVSVTCTHPYGQKIIRAMMHQQGGRVLDVKTRLEHHASAMLDIMVQMASVEPDLKTIASVTFGLLDRSGYGPQQKIETSDKRRSSMDQTTIARIAGALDESNRIGTTVMPYFKQKAPPMDSPNAPGKINRDSFEFIESEAAHKTGTDA